MRGFAGLVPPEVGTRIRDLIQILFVEALQDSVSIGAASRMHQHAMIALAEVDQIGPDTAHRPDLRRILGALIDGDEAGDPALGQHLIHDVRAQQPGLRPCRRGIVDHHGQRPVLHRGVQRLPG
ncbi:hypothetical protein D3C85_1254700 [compost metagenome]